MNAGGYMHHDDLLALEWSLRSSCLKKVNPW